MKTALRETEAQFQRCVIEAAQALGWRVHWAWRSFHSPQGWPDLVLCHPVQRRLCFAELKVRGRLTPAQAAWLQTLRQVPGIEVYEWRPEDFEALVKVLAGPETGGLRASTDVAQE